MFHHTSNFERSSYFTPKKLCYFPHHDFGFYNINKTKVHGNRQLFEDQSTLKKTPFWKVFLKSVNPFYLAVPHHSQSYCLFVLYIQMLTIFGTASKRKEIILVIFAAGNVKNNDELFLLQLLIHMNSGKSFSMFIRAKKEKKIMKRL